MKRKTYFIIVSVIIAMTILIPVYTGFGRGQSQGVSADEIKKMEDAMPTEPVVKPAKPRKLLVFSLTMGFVHTSMPYWDKALEIMGKKTGAFEVVISKDPDVFLPDSLKQFDAICFNNTVGLNFSPEKTPEICNSIMDFIKGGKGVIGIHGATDNFNNWPEARKMFGTYFTSHPWTAGGGWAVKIDEPDHPLMASFKGHKGFRIDDEIYLTNNPLYSRDDRLVLMSVNMDDEVTRTTARAGNELDTGISWIREVEKGRLFYCSLGHQHAVTWTKPILEHYLRGIQFALGDLKCDATPKGAKTK